MIKRVMIAAPGSGSGKTGVTIALLSSLKKQKKKTVSFKCGPDYIDPLFHRSVLGIGSFNLDTFFTGEEKTKELFESNSEGYEYAVIEGVMGLYDGLGGIKEEGSSYHLAKTLQAPVILVVDGKGMGKSLAALIKGYQDYDVHHLIKGVILNRVSSSFFEIIKPVIERENHVKVLGYLPERKDVSVSSRHLGLVTPDGISDLGEVIGKLTQEFEAGISAEDLQKIFDDSEKSGPEEITEELKEEEGKKREITESRNFTATEGKKETKNGKCVIAVARDEAFCFLYEENIRELEKCGAKIQYFSPLRDGNIPEDADALLLPGGYPELYLKELSSNETMLESVRDAYKNNMPVVAECGGFMYLHRSITDMEGKEFQMAGVIDSVCRYTGRSVRFGYIEVREKKESFLPPGECIKGHEFHYYDSVGNGDSCIACKPVTGKEYECIFSNERCFLGYAHLYYPSNREFARNYVKKACEYRHGKQ